MSHNNTLSRRTAIAALPLGILGLTATAKGITNHLTPTNNRVLDDRGLSYALELITEASTSGISSSFVAFAHHLSTLAEAGDSEQIHAIAQRLLDHLYAEDNHYNETRDRWLAEETDYFAEVVDMDDQDLTSAQRESASERANVRHARRSGEV